MQAGGAGTKSLYFRRVREVAQIIHAKRANNTTHARNQNGPCWNGLTTLTTNESISTMIQQSRPGKRMGRPQPSVRRLRAWGAALVLVVGVAVSSIMCVADAFILRQPTTTSSPTQAQQQLLRLPRPSTQPGSGHNTAQVLSVRKLAGPTRSAPLAASSVVDTAASGTTRTGTLPSEFWTWKRAPGEEYRIRYQQQGDSGPVVICVHGFGGNCDHWRKNLPVLGSKYRAYSIDLLGYGFSDKPSPRNYPPNFLYCFETWARQIEGAWTWLRTSGDSLRPTDNPFPIL